MNYKKMEMEPNKKIALVAHDNKKQDLLEWAKFNRVLLSHHKVYATGTTLGSDNGVGVCAALAVMEDASLVHGPLEFLFTTEEETGLTGARSIEPVILSAYKTTLPFTLRAARPMVCTKEVSERKNPSLSASKMATSDTSGKSRPSRKRLTPTTTSILP